MLMETLGTEDGPHSRSTAKRRMTMCSSRLVTFFFTALWAANCTTGQTPPAPRTAVGAAAERPRAEVELESVIIDAKTARAEVAADALLRIADLELIRDRQSKRELIEDAFRRAAGAQQPVKRKFWSGVIDSRPGYLAKAYDLDLDRLSLEIRAVRAMLAVDKQLGRELFTQIPEPQLPTLSCDDALAYDVSGFYDTLRQVAQESFAPKEKRQGNHTDFVLTYVEGMKSPAQIAPILGLLSSIESTPDQLAVLVHAFSNTLKKVSGDPRSFYFSLRYDGTASSVQQLVAACKQKGVSTGELLEAYRAYLIRNLGANQCAETQTKRGKELTDAYLAKVNEWIGTPIEADDVRPSRIEGSAKIHEYWASPKARELMRKYKSLRFAGGSEIPEAERKTEAWGRALQEFMNDLDGWNSDEETEADYFNQKCALYEALIEITPAGLMRTKVLQDFIRYLRDTNIQNESRMEWMQHAGSLLQAAGSPNSTGQGGLFEMLRDSGDATLQLYARLQELRRDHKEIGQNN